MEVLKVLVIHNYTEGFAKGGESNVFEDETELLESKGHLVHRLVVSNTEGTQSSIWTKMSFFFNGPWSNYGFNLVKNEIKEFRPDLVHVHNFFFILSPKIFLAIKKEGIPIVVTLHNYRFVVPCSQMIYKGKHCDVCLGKNPWRILVKRCYKNSFLASLFRYRFYYWSQKKHNWWNYIDRFIALTENSKTILIRGGIPANKIVLKPNFLVDPKPKDFCVGKAALFIGRLSEEKGIKELLMIWQNLNYQLKIIGTGPLENSLKELNKNNKVQFLGELDRKGVLKEISNCAFVIVPSLWQEPFGLVNIESLSMGKPVLATRNGAMKDIIIEGENGIFFDITDPINVKTKIEMLFSEESLLRDLGLRARQSYLEKYTSEINYETLIGIYRELISA